MMRSVPGAVATGLAFPQRKGYPVATALGTDLANRTNPLEIAYGDAAPAGEEFSGGQ